MPVIVVTRLRLRDPAYLDEFFAAAIAVIEQAKNAAGSIATDALAEANNTWWSSSAWQDRHCMRAYVRSEPHLSTMKRLDDWCDEATFVDWEQDSPELPGWQTGYAHIVADGLAAKLTHGTAAHEGRAFPPPVEAA
jgi:hypothetical protein